MKTKVVMAEAIAGNRSTNIRVSLHWNALTQTCKFHVWGG